MATNVSLTASSFILCSAVKSSLLLAPSISRPSANLLPNRSPNLLLIRLFSFHSTLRYICYGCRGESDKGVFCRRLRDLLNIGCNLALARIARSLVRFNYRCQPHRKRDSRRHVSCCRLRMVDCVADRILVLDLLRYCYWK